uniref:Malectin n=1 Tax=Cyprinus carpio TaxID=7962 RepID=A0A8C1PB92_CYPCA
MRRVTLRCVARLVFAALWLLVEVCRAETGAPSLAERVIWAVNAGGDAHTDVHGIHYKKDPLEGKLGKEAVVSGPCLVYYKHSKPDHYNLRNIYLFDLSLFMSVCVTSVRDICSLICYLTRFLHAKKTFICIIVGYYDNPKICALYVMKGKLEDVPKLQPHPGLEKREEEEEEEDDGEGGESEKKSASTAPKNPVRSGPRTPNPYATDNSSLMFPILVAFGVFIPTLFCLCRL